MCFFHRGMAGRERQETPAGRRRRSAAAGPLRFRRDPPGGRRGTARGRDRRVPAPYRQITRMDFHFPRQKRMTKQVSRTTQSTNIANQTPSSCRPSPQGLAST